MYQLIQYHWSGISTSCRQHLFQDIRAASDLLPSESSKLCEIVIPSHCAQLFQSCSIQYLIFNFHIVQPKLHLACRTHQQSCLLLPVGHMTRKSICSWNDDCAMVLCHKSGTASHSSRSWASSRRIFNISCCWEART